MLSFLERFCWFLYNFNIVKSILKFLGQGQGRFFFKIKCYFWDNFVSFDTIHMLSLPSLYVLGSRTIMSSLKTTSSSNLADIVVVVLHRSQHVVLPALQRSCIWLHCCCSKKIKNIIKFKKKSNGK